MTHSIFNAEQSTELTVLEFNGDVSIQITYTIQQQSFEHTLSKKDLHDFIGVLLHVQSKMRK